MEDVYGSSDEEYCNQVYDDGDDSDYDGIYADKDCENGGAPSCKVSQNCGVFFFGPPLCGNWVAVEIELRFEFML